MLSLVVRKEAIARFKGLLWPASNPDRCPWCV